MYLNQFAYFSQVVLNTASQNRCGANFSSVKNWRKGNLFGKRSMNSGGAGPSGHRQGRHPKGLKGREIGLFYAQRNRKRFAQDFSDTGDTSDNSISILQEFFANKRIVPKYDFIPNNSQVIQCQVSVSGMGHQFLSAIASGSSKREAKHKAAKGLLDKLDPEEVAKFCTFHTQRQKEKRENNTQRGKVHYKRDFIDISSDQLKEVENITQLLNENAVDVKDNAFFGTIDYESEFMKSYRGNLKDNAASTSNTNNVQSKEVESWEMLEEAPVDPSVESTKPTKSKFENL